MRTKYLILFALSVLIVNTLSAQTIKKDVETLQTKMDRFTSKTGTLSKFIDSKLPALKSSFSSPETRIRKVIAGSESVYFYQIEKSGQYTNSTASIEYSDLLELIKALSALQSDVEKDVATNPDYLENKFTTVDGFQVGYYVSKGKASWYIKLEKFGSENTIFINDFALLETAFKDAKEKIELLKNHNTKL